MGSISKMLKEVSGAPEDEREQKERLELLLKLAQSKIQTYKDRIEMNFSNPGAIEKLQIPGIRAMRYIEQYHIAAAEGLNQKIADHMDAAIDAFFSIGGDGSTKKAVQGGVKSLISAALDGFIGSTEAGESEEQIFVVIPENNAFVRADIACWKYHFEQHKFINQTDTAIAYVLCKSVVDHTKISLDELIYLATDALSKRAPVDQPDYYTMLAEGDKTKVNAIRDAAAATGNKEKRPSLTDKQLADLRAINPHLYISFKWKETEKKADGTDDTTKPAKWEGSVKSYALIDGNPSSSQPAGISEVSAYIEELIKVWKKLKEDRMSS